MLMRFPCSFIFHLQAGKTQTERSLTDPSLRPQGKFQACWWFQFGDRFILENSGCWPHTHTKKFLSYLSKILWAKKPQEKKNPDHKHCFWKCPIRPVQPILKNAFFFSSQHLLRKQPPMILRWVYLVTTAAGQSELACFLSNNLGSLFLRNVQTLLCGVDTSETTSVSTAVSQIAFLFLSLK